MSRMCSGLRVPSVSVSVRESSNGCGICCLPKVARIRANFELVKRKLVQVEEKDALRNFKNPITGEHVMELYGIPPCREIGLLKEMVKEAILDGVIGNNFEEADAFMRAKAAEMGLQEKIV